MKPFVALLATSCLLTGCGSVNSYLTDKTTTVEYYRIFDIKTTAPRQKLAAAASAGLSRNVNNANEAMPIPSAAQAPETPGRFSLVNPFEGSRLGALASAAGQLDMRVVNCNGSSWNAQAVRTIERSNELKLTACLFPYRDGYHLDLYAIFQKREGGLLQMSRDMASAMVGTPEQWTEKTMLDIVRAIGAAVPAQITLLEAQPEISGTPWLDR
jgi:hypothetical protein